MSWVQKVLKKNKTEERNYKGKQMSFDEIS